MADSAVRLLKITEVSKLVGLAVPTLWEHCRKGMFPSPVKITSRATRWRSDEVEAWINALPRSRSAA